VKELPAPPAPKEIVLYESIEPQSIVKVVTALATTRALTVLNPGFANGEMLGSVQIGLGALAPETEAALLCLGDQPQMEPATVSTVLAAGRASDWRSVVVPSYAMRAGHPVLLPRAVWPDVLAAQGTLKDALAPHRGHFVYVVVDSPTILADLDTPEDYAREKAVRDG
jgi:molybdenum cofactor cytidylyltransferase